MSDHPLNDEDKKALEYATGYLELRMPKEALRELDSLSPSATNHGGVILLKAQILNTVGEFQDTLKVLSNAPAEVGRTADYYLLYSYAARRANSLTNAYQILEKAVERFPDEALIRYNLACYCAQMGMDADALKHLGLAIALQDSMKQMALEDEDFEPLLHHPDFEKLTRRKTV